MRTSTSLSLNKKDLKSAGKGLLIALAGALLTYMQTLQFDFGAYTPLAVAVNSIAVNLIRLWLVDNKEPLG